MDTRWTGRRPLLRALLLAPLAACPAREPAAGWATNVDLVRPSGQAAVPSGVPSGPERLFLSRRTPLELAPGREDWVAVSAYVQTSASSMVPVPAAVTFESSDPAVAPVRAADSGWARITYADAPLGPMTLEVTVTIQNPTTGPRDLWLGGCPAWLRIYRTPARTDRPVSDVPRGVECGSGAQRVTLAPGASRTYPAGGYRLDIASDTLATGRYYVAAAVDRVRDLLEVPAGAVDVVSPNAGLVFAATTALAGQAGQAADTLWTRVTVRNTNARGVRLEYGACAVALLAYRTATRTGTPVWSSDARRTPDGFGYACPRI